MTKCYSVLPYYAFSWGHATNNIPQLLLYTQYSFLHVNSPELMPTHKQLKFADVLCTKWVKKVKVKSFLSTPWRHIARVEVQFHYVLTFTLDRSEWSTSHPSHFTHGKEPWYPLNRRLGGPQNWSGHFGKKKNLLPLPGFEPQIIQPTAQSL
jgi:hypothetical protein